MKLLLVTDSGESVACLDNVEEYDAQDSGNVLALLDLLESLIASAKGKRIAPTSTSLAPPSDFCGHTGAVGV
jgi:hypothetical protein